MNKLNLKSVDKSTWIRTIVLFAALLNQALVMFGVTRNAIDENSLAHILSYIMTVASAVWSWWKNNSFTEKAQEADGYLKGEYGAKG
ncbi:MAG: phage holin [Clostridia bacterium]|nr:phage holin [Clostridia bacterium]